MKKKKFPVFILCSLLTLTNIQTPWAFSDEAPDDPVFSDESVDDPVFPVELPDDPAFSDEITPDEATYAKASIKSLERQRTEQMNVQYGISVNGSNIMTDKGRYASFGLA